MGWGITGDAESGAYFLAVYRVIHIYVNILPINEWFHQYPRLGNHNRHPIYQLLSVSKLWYLQHIDITFGGKWRDVYCDYIEANIMGTCRTVFYRQIARNIIVYYITLSALTSRASYRLTIYSSFASRKGLRAYFASKFFHHNLNVMQIKFYCYPNCKYLQIYAHDTTVVLSIMAYAQNCSYSIAS